MDPRPGTTKREAPNPIPVLDVHDLGLTLRRHRESIGLTQAEAAGLAGVSHRLWSEVERGARPNASLNTVLRMLQTAGMDMQLTVRARPSPGPGKRTRQGRTA